MLAPSTKLGPYEIQSLIGSGGMGEVYRARDSRLKRDVAIKVLPKALSSDADRLRRFEQEALATAALNHPNILAVFDIGENDGSPFVVSELLEGETLRDRLRTGAIPVRKALDYALQAALGLAAAHGKGIIHRDLKPENLFLTKDGRLKILDFGLAKLTQSEHSGPASLTTIGSGTEAGVVLGTVGYMSPEQVRGQALDPRSDIFSFGAIFYEMLSGKRAFHGDTAADTMSAILKEEPEELSATNRNVSPALERIVHHCLEKNPEARFHSASDIAFDLEHLSGISAGSVRVAPVEAVQPSHKPMALRIVGVLALAAVMLAIGWWLGHGTVSPPPVYKQVTFRRGLIGNARFGPDGGIIYSASWDGEIPQIYMTRADGPGSHELGIKDAELLGVSRNGELAVRLHSVTAVNGLSQAGTLARVPIGGGTPREVLNDVMDADWAADGENMAVARYIPENAHWHLEYPIGTILLDSINWISTPKISPDGKWIAFADHENNGGDDEGSIAVIASDGKGGEKKLSTGWEAIEGIVWSGDKIWFTSAMSGFSTNAHEVSLSGKLRDITNVPGGMWLQDLRNGSALVVTQRGGRGVRALAAGAKAERELGWFGWALLAGLSRDGSKVLFYDVGEAGGRDYTVFLRDVDGSPPATLGQGTALALSSDGKWIITEPARGGSLKLVPAGAGEAKTLTHDSVNYNAVSFLPDGKQLLAAGIEPGHGERNYLINLSSGDSKPVTADGVAGVNLSPSGKEAAVQGPDGKWGVWPLDGGATHPIPGLESKDHMIGWSGDGSSVFMTSTQRTGGAAKVYKVNLATGKTDLWKTLGAESEFAIAPLISADEKSYAYGYGYQTSEAYVVSGLK